MNTRLSFIVAVIITMLTFSGCKKKDTVPTPPADPCATISCVNGHCANGQCVCDAGYTGADCSQQITPTKITITKIEITRFPATNSTGGSWDPFDGPDISVKLSLGSTVLYNSPTYYNNALQSTTYPFTPSPYIDLNSPTSQYTIEVNDYDATSSSDWMGGINFTPYYSGYGFPAVRNIDAGGAVAFTVYYSYTW